METFISPHDTAFIHGNDCDRATLVVVSGSARDYFAQQEEAQQAPQESARQDRLYLVLVSTGCCLALAAVGVLAWMLCTGTLTMSALFLALGLLGIAAVPGVVLRALISSGKTRKEREIAQRVATVNDQARPFSFLIRNSADASVQFHPRDSGLFTHVLESMTPHRCARIRELADHNEREVVRQALVLLAQEYETRRSQEQEQLQAQHDAHRMRAAHALLEPSPEDAQHLDSRRA